MTNTLNFGHVDGLTAAEQQQLSDLAEAYSYHQSRNATKDKYYEGHVTLQDVNLGIALPKGLNKLEVGLMGRLVLVMALSFRACCGLYQVRECSLIAVVISPTDAITSLAEGRSTALLAFQVGRMRSTSTSTPLRPSITTQLARS